MKVLFLSVEAAPLAKVGGLGDVAGELPLALRRIGVEAVLALPAHAGVEDSELTYGEKVGIVVESSEGARRVNVRRAELGRLRLMLVEHAAFRKSQDIYTDTEGDSQRFTFFSLAALKACETFAWKPAVVHAHDWHTAAALAWLQLRTSNSFWEGTARVLTIHNLPFYGRGGEGGPRDFFIPPSSDRKLPSWARPLPLPMGMAAAHLITTVSPTYAQEIQTPEFGCGLERWLQANSGRMQGILNGIDYDIWNPQHDQALASRYDREHLYARQENKRALLREVGLAERDHWPLLGVVARLAAQKGTDLALDALEGLLNAGWQLVVLGTGDPALERRLHDFARYKRTRARVFTRFDESLARRMYAGCDMMIIPSRYEPCGLSQMIAMRYGCVPVVRRTGGLADTVDDYVPGGIGVGFTFGPPQPAALRRALRTAFKIFQDQRRWRGLQLRGMAKDFSWDRSARKYQALYRQALETAASA